jgi:hypothetical protein
MRRRLYPETTPALASYWLRTVWSKGYKLAWWKDLNRGLTKALRGPILADEAREALVEIQSWVRENVLRKRQAPEPPRSRERIFHENVRQERLRAYVVRLLNQWLPAEVARVMTEWNEWSNLFDGETPAVATGRALERLLVREQLSSSTLEMLLDPELLSPQYVYPADAEVLQDVVLALLGQTEAPAIPTMPAILVSVAPDCPLPADYAGAVGKASLVSRDEREEVQVPIAAEHAIEILKHDPVRISSVIVTNDGRWWEAENLQSGAQHSIIYRPAGRLRIDYSRDHAKLAAPWPDTQLCWSGGVHFAKPFELFGRAWHASRWETDGQGTWVTLEFSHPLTVTEGEPAEGAAFRKFRPATVDMAWAALENALARSLVQKNREPIEQLRRFELIPLGRALFELAESLRHRLMVVKRETIETHLKAIRFLEAETKPVYGRVPWRIAPTHVQRALVKRRSDAGLADLVTQAFDDAPEAFRAAVRSTSDAAPSQA